MTSHAIDDNEGAVLSMSPTRAKNNHTNHKEDSTVLPTWLWRTLHGFMMAVTTAAVFFVFWAIWYHQISINSAESEIKVNKFVNDQQDKSLTVLENNYDRINEKLDALRDDMRKLSSRMP